MTENTTITPTALDPSAYLTDAQGRLVPRANIADADLLRDQLVTDLVLNVRLASAELGELKAHLLERISEHLALVAQDYGVNITGRNGNVVLTSYDGRYKIERVSADRIVVGEQIHAAEALVREYLADATREAGPALVAIVDRAFRRNPKTGQLNVARLLDFISVRIDDPRWRGAQTAIRDSLHASESVTYFRAYERADAMQPWRQIPLDFSSIAPVVRSEGGGVRREKAEGAA